MEVILIFVVFLILILVVKKENYGQVNDLKGASIQNVGNDININNWLNSNNSLNGSDAVLKTTYTTYQIGDLNRLCWADTSGKCAGFRKQLKVGGGGSVWFLYTSDATFSGVPTNQQQVYSSPILVTVKNLIIPQFVIFAKSDQNPFPGNCVWTKTATTCSATGCGTTGTRQDTYNVTNYSSPCYGSENQLLVAGTQTVAGAPCTAPACNLYDDGVPGTVTGGSGQSTLTASSITDCQVACTKKVGCKIIQFTAPSTCTGYTAKTSVTPGTGSTYVYTRVR